LDVDVFGGHDGLAAAQDGRVMKKPSEKMKTSRPAPMMRAG